MKANLFVLLFGCLHAIVAAWAGENEHYWRDYEKDVPRDAFPGGVDGRGKTTYIGQTLHKTCDNTISICGQIFEAEQKMKFEYDYAEQQTKENVQILCINDPGYLEWIKTSAEDIHALTNRRLIRGGMEPNATVYIGRVHADDQISVGRIVIEDQPSLNGLYTTIDGKHLHVFSSFDVLGYKENYRVRGMKGSSNAASASYVILVACVLRFLYSI